jgi:recombination protein RecT
VAQFQIMHKGFKQLALRSGQFLIMNATDVREGELKKRDRLKGLIEFAWEEDEAVRNELKIIGYVSYFQLLNGYSQTLYMTTKEIHDHAKKYSQTFQNDKGRWKDDFNAMSLKTVIKLNLSKNAPLSIEMQSAMIADQGVIKDADTLDVAYLDNEEPEPTPVDKEAERVVLMINEAKTIQDLNKLLTHVKPEQQELFNDKLKSLKK